MILMHHKAFIFGLFLVYSAISPSVCDYEYELPDGYIDPTDMFSFDYASKTNRKEGDPIKDEVPKEENVKEENEEVAEKKDSKDSVSTNQDGQQEKPLEESESDTEIPDSYIDPSDMGSFDTAPTRNSRKSVKDKSTQVNQLKSCPHPFLHRFVGVIYRKIEYVGTPPNIKDYEMTVSLNDRNWLVLQDFADDCKTSASDVTRVLEEMVTDIHVQKTEQFIDRIRRKFEDFLNISFEDALRMLICFFLLTCTLALEIVSSVSWTRQLKRLIVVGICISFVMTYIHEIKLAEAKNRSNLSKEIPKECIDGLQDVTYWGSLKTMWRETFSVEKDPCAKYHEDHIINPALTVTPTKVFAVTLTRFIVEPMEHIGTAFSKAFKNIFRELPVTLWIPAFVFVIVVIIGFLLIVSVFFGYNFSFNLPFWTGLHMGPQTAQHPQVDMIMDENRRQRTTIQDLEERLRQREALPPPPTEEKTSKPKAILGRGSSTRHEAPAPTPPIEREETSLPYPDFNDQPVRNRGPTDTQGQFYDPPRYEEPTLLRRRHTNPATHSQRSPTLGQGDASYAFIPEQHPAERGLQTSESSSRNPIGFEHLMQEDVAGDTRNHPKSGLHPDGEESEISSMCSIADSKLPIVAKSMHQTQQHASVPAMQNIGDPSTVQSDPGTEKFSMLDEPKKEEPISTDSQIEVETIPAPERAAAAVEEPWEEVSKEFHTQEGLQGENKTEEKAGEKMEKSSTDIQMELEKEAQRGFKSMDNQ